MRALVLTLLAAALAASAVSAAERPAPARRIETGFLDRTLTLDGIAHRYQVFVPQGYDSARAWPLVLFLHGSGERGADGLLPTEIGIGTALRRHAERFPAIVVFPQAPPDTRWPGDATPVALAALDRAMAEFHVDADRVYLTGISMGGGGAWHVAYRDPDRFAALLVVCGRLVPVESAPAPVVPPDDGPLFGTLARRLRGLPIWVFHGDADPVVPVEDSRRIVAALRALGAPVRYTELAGVGHGAWDAAYQAPATPAWLFAQARGGRK